MRVLLLLLWFGGACLASNHPLMQTFSCGEVVFSLMCRYHGKEDEAPESLRKQCSFMSLKTEFEKVGLVCTGRKANMEHLVSLTEPCVLQVTLKSGAPHFCVVSHNARSKAVHIHDPTGLMPPLLDYESLEKIWSGNLLLVQKRQQP